MPTNLTDSLDGIQEWFQAAITTPWHADLEELEQVVRDGEGSLSPAQQLDIYARSYQGRLIECMQSEFPVLHQALGRDLFVRFASEYLIAHPSRSYTLTALGAEFPQYLRATRPDDEDELWPEFVIELATMERFFSEVFHGEGVEDTGSSPSTETAEIALEPNTRRLVCNFPVDEYFLSAREGLKKPGNMEPPAMPDPKPITLIIFRRDYVVQLRRVL